MAAVPEDDVLFAREEADESESVVHDEADEDDARKELTRAEMTEGEKKATDAFEQADSLEDKLLFYKERECLLLLLEARKLLATMLRHKENEAREKWDARLKLEELEKKKSGRLSVQEIQDMLQKQADEEDYDMVTGMARCSSPLLPRSSIELESLLCVVTLVVGVLPRLSLSLEITELKKQLVVSVRLNHKLDRDVAKLDKRIALLIKNRTSLQDVLMQSKGRKRQVVNALEQLEGKRLEVRSWLFTAPPPPPPPLLPLPLLFVTHHRSTTTFGSALYNTCSITKTSFTFSKPSRSTSPTVSTSLTRRSSRASSRL